MPDVDLPFTRAEYAERLAATRTAMERAEVHCLIVIDPANMAWLTGYDGWSFYVPQAVIVGPEGEPIFWARMMDTNGAHRTCYMAEDQIVGYPEHMVMTPDHHPMTHLAETLADRGWAELPIGVEMESYYYSAKAHRELARALGTEPSDASLVINWLRAVKSPAELGYMRQAARIVERQHETVRERIAPGMAKNALVAEISRAAIMGAEDADGPFGGDYPSIVPMLPTGVDASAPHLTWDDRPIPAGSATFFELAGCRRRYHVPLCRTVVLGEPSRDMRAAETALLEGLDAGIDAARAGTVAGDVARAFQAVLAKHGIHRDARCGYPIGISYPPDWGERTYSIRDTDRTELLPDMTFHFMPGLWMADWGLEITETLRVRTEGPAECLADVPRAIFVKA